MPTYFCHALLASRCRAQELIALLNDFYKGPKTLNPMMLRFVTDFLKNGTRERFGKRWGSPTLDFFTAILIRAGPAVMQLVGLNLGGPSLSTAQLHRRMLKRVLEVGFAAANFDAAKEFYTNVLAQRSKTPGKHAFAIASDDTVNAPALAYCLRSRTIIGTCGRRGSCHVCKFEAHPLPSDRSARYAFIRELFDTATISHCTCIALWLFSDAVHLSCDCTPNFPSVRA